MGLSGFIKTALYLIIGLPMAAMRRRKPPKIDAMDHAAKALDKTTELGGFIKDTQKAQQQQKKGKLHKIRQYIWFSWPTSVVVA